MSFEIGNLKFIDSLNFMPSSLEKLVVNLYDKNDKYKKFKHMQKEFTNDLDVLCQKGFYPYDWMDDNNKLSHNGLPTIDNFYSMLTKENITE